MLWRPADLDSTYREWRSWVCDLWVDVKGLRCFSGANRRANKDAPGGSSEPIHRSGISTVE
jgi:hypothetical protein